MLHTISPQDMQEMESAFLEGTQYPSILLMEHAAQAVVRELRTLVAQDARVLPNESGYMVAQDMTLAKYMIQFQIEYLKG